MLLYIKDIHFGSNKDILDVNMNLTFNFKIM